MSLVNQKFVFVITVNESVNQKFVFVITVND